MAAGLDDGDFAVGASEFEGFRAGDFARGGFPILRRVVGFEGVVEPILGPLCIQN